MKNFFAYFFGEGTEPEFAIFTLAHLIPVLVAAVSVFLPRGKHVVGQGEGVSAEFGKQKGLFPRLEGYGLEINMLGIMTGRHYPSERFYKIAAEVGNNVVIGCDAHKPEALSDVFWQKKSREFAESFGLNVLDEIKLIKP